MSKNIVYTIPDWDLPSYSTPPKKKKVVKPVDPFAFSHIDNDLKKRASIITKQINNLKQEHHEIITALKKRELLRNQNRLRKVQLYALRLEDNCWYIGMTYDPIKRLARHKTGKGAQWTKVHPPIELFETRETNEYIQDSAAKLEDDMTLEYALKYGTEYVRGGGFCQAKPRWPNTVKALAYR